MNARLSYKKILSTIMLMIVTFVFTVPQSVEGYAQGTYYSQATYYLQGDYYAQGAYVVPGTVVTFTSSGTWSVPSGVGSVRVLVVGGGGGGGSAVDRTGGGGGGGGVVENLSYDVTPGGSVSVTVGAGGAANTAGGNSAFGSITANGGGRGGQQSSIAGSGGSGGGAYHNNSDSGAAGTAGQGFAGGNGYDGANATNGTFTGGGGGGASEAGANGVAEFAGDGGDGRISSISGSSVRYGGGGGGGCQNVGTESCIGGAGGLGGGGGGGDTGTNGTDGTDGYGGGGGGGGETNGGANNAGGSGGDGIVIIRYRGPSGQTYLNGDVLFEGNLSISGALSKGSGTFVIDHPLDPENKLLYHSFVESPDVKNIYDGIAVLDENGEAVVALPEYFEALNGDFRYQYTAVGRSAPNLHIKKEIENNQFTIAGGSAGTKVSWQVTGIRHDPYILANPIIPEVEKGPDELVDKGEYVFPEYPRSQ